jgi:predicted PurR-regulated permease PerM
MAIILVAMWTIRSVLLLTFASIVLVILLTIPVRWWMKLRVPFLKSGKLGRGSAIILTLLLAIVVIAILMLLVFPGLIQQFASLINVTIPQGIQRVADWWDGGNALREMPLLDNIDLTPLLGTMQESAPSISLLGTSSLGIANVIGWTTSPEKVQSILGIIELGRQFSVDAGTLQQIGTQILNAIGQVGGSVLPLLGGLANVLLSSLIVVFISLYFLAEPGRYVDRVVLYTPVWYRSRMRTVLDRMDGAIRAWLRVTGVSMLVAGILTGVLLYLLGIEQWAALGTLAGIASFIPNFGTLLALIPALLVGAVQAPDKVLLIILIVYGVSFIQSQVLSPILANEDMKMPPVLILVGQIVFGIFFGFLGLMFAVPLMAILLVLLDEVYVKDVLGDTKSVPDENVIESGAAT